MYLALIGSLEHTCILVFHCNTVVVCMNSDPNPDRISSVGNLSGYILHSSGPVDADAGLQLQTGPIFTRASVPTRSSGTLESVLGL